MVWKARMVLSIVSKVPSLAKQYEVLVLLKLVCQTTSSTRLEISCQNKWPV